MSAIAQSAISFGACVPSSSYYCYSVSFARLLTRLFFFVVFGRPRQRFFFILSSLDGLLWCVSVGLRWNNKKIRFERQTDGEFFLVHTRLNK